MLEAILGSIHSKVDIPNISNVLEKLMVTALNSEEDLIRLSSSRLLATLINKTEESLALTLLKKLMEHILMQLNSPLNSSKFNCSYLFTWIMKGVILRGNLYFEECIVKWFELIGREDIGRFMVKNLPIIFTSEDLYLTLDSHCNVR